MKALGRYLAVLAITLAATGAAGAADRREGADANLPPYEMVRTLEYVQDSIVRGDHAAMDMQTYLLSEIDKRLRAAAPDVFEDGRNVDAALVYAMSGGNPSTLALLASRDADGHFDHALTDALEGYFSGRQQASAKALLALQPQFLDTKIGAYVTLVTANAAARENPRQALKLFDWVRLLAPGSILEESALRRSIYLADQLHAPLKGIDYATSYARRFIRSPYAGQFADLFVRLVVDNTATVTESQVRTVLQGLDKDRQSRVYLRIARASAIAGETDLAAGSAERAGALGGSDPVVATLAGFYRDLATVAGPKVGAVRAGMEQIPPADLSGRDAALRSAALAVSEAVLSPPSERSIAQAEEAAKNAPAPETHSLLPAGGLPTDKRKAAAGAPKERDSRIAEFLDPRRDTLKAIDALLKKGG